ncbi:MAG: bifunctional UDP-N-acetylglucosamine diphosphorylase/glucosamine-1-phosphate N-acetyltransferase GlmU [Dehalococcoidia bacterium]|nr:bifunctional UDP-N-acetylglucosamine diphosphorylase/glucosamine-1-phosphate N-acetyltransferase GlmU [Dehalococcoidia bacterium]
MDERTNGNRSDWACIVLAAGAGTRMNSRVPKPLHPLGGKSIVSHVLNAAKGAGVGPITLLHDGSRTLPEAIGETYQYAVQQEHDGTGGAVRSALRSFGNSPPRMLVVLNGDTPFVSSESIRALAEIGDTEDAVMAVLGSEEALSSGLGRLTIANDGSVEAIVEARDQIEATLDPVNVGAYSFDVEWLTAHLPRLPQRDSGEYLITDLVEMASTAGQRVAVHLAEDPWEGLGINTRVDLAEAERELRRRTLEALMLSGVTISDPDTTYVDQGISIGRDTLILPNTHITGTTTIGEECEIGPGAQIDDTTIGNECRVLSSVLEGATLEDHVDVGPFSHLRMGAYLSEGVHIGNFGEVKASRLGRDVAMGHFGYVGDAEIGDAVNLGAGVVTCNFDGVDKHRTVVGDHAFIGSDTMLVAPVSVGAESSTGAGSVVTEDVPPQTLVAGVPTRVLRSASRQGTDDD